MMLIILGTLVSLLCPVYIKFCQAHLLVFFFQLYFLGGSEILSEVTQAGVMKRILIFFDFAYFQIV